MYSLNMLNWVSVSVSALRTRSLLLVSLVLSLCLSISIGSNTAGFSDNGSPGALTQKQTLLSLKQIYDYDSTIQDKEKAQSDNFDETGVEPAFDDGQETGKTETGQNETPAQNSPATDPEATEADVLDNAVAQSGFFPPNSMAFSEYYNEKMRELNKLEDGIRRLCEAKSSAALANGGVAIDCTKNSSLIGPEKSQFERAWLSGNLALTQHHYDNAQRILLKSLFGADIPASKGLMVQAIWMDRGSIVSCPNEAALRDKIRRLAAAGFNLIFFETVNAGYAIYPSTIAEQNPMTKGWDPLAVAVDEAHKQNIELHAWVWVFAVGNARHNHILGVAGGHPGPVLSKPDMASAALRNKAGTIYIPEQPEYWLSPAKFEARQYLTNLYTEIVKNYNVDGLQLDYIRYPFQKGGFAMGYEAIKQYQEETGLNDGSDAEVNRQAWAAWKAFQVSSFVRETSIALKRIKPNLTMSAAVFALPRNRRMLLIQQDWETWVHNGWIDALIPMSYSKSASGISRLVDYTHESSGNRTLVYPGISLGRLSSLKLLQTLEALDNEGVMGSSLFAMAQLNSAKAQVLGLKKANTITLEALPHRQPVIAAEAYLSRLKTMLDGLVGSQNWLIQGNDIAALQRAVSELHTEVQHVKASHEMSLSAKLKAQSRLATMESQLVTWKYASLDEVSALQLAYMEPLVKQTARVLRFMLNRDRY